MVIRTIVKICHPKEKEENIKLKQESFTEYIERELGNNEMEDKNITNEYI